MVVGGGWWMEGGGLEGRRQRDTKMSQKAVEKAVESHSLATHPLAH